MNSDNLRNWLNSFVADLRAKRVIPIVVLLIAAAVAIPLLLSHSGKAAALQPLPPAPTVTAPNPATALVGRRHEPKQNYLTGPAHNPFISHTTTTAASATGTATTSTGSPSGSSSSATASGTTTASNTCPNGEPPVQDDGHELCEVCRHAVAVVLNGKLSCLTSGQPCSAADEPTYNAYGFSCVDGRLELGSGRTKTTTTTTTVPAKPLPYSNYEVEATLLQAGASATPTVFHNLSRDQLLPSDTSPLITFLGVRTDAQSAVFVVAGGATVTGDGLCSPSASTCTFLTLVPGQAAKLVYTPSGGTPEIFTLTDVQEHKVSSNSSVVTVDPTGAADVKSAKAYIPQLKTISYGQYTGLLTIDLGSTVPVTP